MEADKGGAITIINKEDYVHNYNPVLTDNTAHTQKPHHIWWKHTMKNPRTSLATYHPTTGYIFQNFSM